MEWKRLGNTCLVRVDRGEEALSALRAVCACEHILLAEVSGIGALSSAELGLYDLETHAFRGRSIDRPLELASLTGTVTGQNGVPYLHLHAVVCDANQRAYGGHAAALWVSATCEITLRIMDGHVSRRHDPDTGLMLLNFEEPAQPF